MNTLAYWVTGKGSGELRREQVADAPRPGHSLISAEFSGVSPGTERLVGLGQVPDWAMSEMACRYMGGSFGLPIKYGYSLVGTGIAGSLENRRVFVMHPHQRLAEVADQHALVLPDDVLAPRATLIPNAETALNAIWDAELEAADRSVIIGAGCVGLLAAFVLHRFGRGPTTVLDIDGERLDFAANLAFVDHAAKPGDLASESFSVAFHTSGSASGLQSAIELVGFEGRVVELSWYGDKTVELSLGTHFHFGRKRILSSQVGHIAPSRRQTHDETDRLHAVLDLLRDSRLDALLSPPVPFPQMPDLMREIYAGKPHDPLPLIEYEGNESCTP